MSTQIRGIKKSKTTGKSDLDVISTCSQILESRRPCLNTWRGFCELVSALYSVLGPLARQEAESLMLLWAGGEPGGEREASDEGGERGNGIDRVGFH